MAATERMGLTICLLVLANLVIRINSFNIDLEKPFLFSKPDMYFGYSIAFSNDQSLTVYVGAPLSDEANEGILSSGKKWGTVYKCPISYSSSDCQLLHKVDTTDNNGNEDKTDQWMGATVYSDSKYVMACAPRYKTKDPDGNIYLHGKCDHIDPINKDLANFVWNPCGEESSRLSELHVCQTGFSAMLAGSDDRAIFSGVPNMQLNKGATSGTTGDPADYQSIYGYCQAGFSSKMVEDSEKTRSVMSGTFTTADLNENATKTFYGRIAKANGDGKNTGWVSGEGLNFFDYMGYSIASGHFKSDKNSIIAVGGAPRGDDLRGLVILYDISQKGYPVFLTINAPKEPDEPQVQTGSYFGASLGATDINGDGFADLVVGAPYYESDKPNAGAFHVYMNDGQNGLYKIQTELGTYKNGFFAYTIGSVGDLNNDEMNDIAIGEPWGGEDGKGVVYVYYGTKDKFKPLVLKQTIKASDVANPGRPIEGFGFSFAEYYPYKKENKLLNNADDAAYNDIIVGAYDSGHVAVLRSRPILTITGSLKSETKRIDLYNKYADTMCSLRGKDYKCINNLDVCFATVGTTTNTEVEYLLTLDAEGKAGKRGFIDDDGLEKSVYNSTYTVEPGFGTVNCVKIKIYLKNNTKDIYRPFVIKLDWKYKDSCSPTKRSLCPIANGMLELTNMLKIPYIAGCNSDGNDVCNSDLSLSLEADLGGRETVAIGVTEKIILDIVISNDAEAENAFSNKLQIIYKEELVSPHKPILDAIYGIPIWTKDVTQDSDISTMEVELKSPIKPGEKMRVKVEFGVQKKIGKGESIKFKATVITESTEKDKMNNEKDLTLEVVISAELTASGSVEPVRLKWDEKITKTETIGPKITHKFFFQNSGPSGAKSSNILIKIPEKIGKDYILNFYDIQLTGSSDEGTIGDCVKQDLNPLELHYDKKGNKTRKRRNTDSAAAQLVTCNDAICREFRCSLNFLDFGASATVRVISSLVEATFQNVIKASRTIVAEVVITSNVVDIPAEASNSDKSTLQINSPYKVIKGESEELEWWIILLCVLGALLIICLIVFVLYKKGFFKRKKHDKQEKDEDEDEDGIEEEQRLRKGEANDYY